MRGKQASNFGVESTPESSRQSFTTALLNVGVLLCMVLATIQCVVTFRGLHGAATHRDFTTYYLSANAVANHLNPYDFDFTPTITRLGWDTGGIAHTTDPPTFLLMIAPLAHFSIYTAFWIWTAFNAICLALSIFLLFGPGSGIPPRLVWVLVPLLTFFVPIRVHFSVGQSKLPVLLLVVLVMRLMGKKCDRTAGLALAAAILMRVFPVILLGYVILQRRWRVFAYTVIGLTVGVLLTLFILGAGAISGFQTGVSSLTTHWTRMPQDLSLDAFISRFFWHFIGSYPASPIDHIRKLAIAGETLLITGLTIRATLATPSGEDRDWSIFSLWVVTSVLLSPIAWIYYQVFYILLFARMASAASARRLSLRAIIMTVVCLVTMYVWVLVGVFYSEHTDTLKKYVLSEFGALSMLAGYVSAYWFATDEPGVSPVPLWAMPAEIWRRLMPAM